MESKIRTLRLEKGISVRALAKIAGISPATISLLESNEDRKASLLTVNKLAAALEIPIQELDEFIDNGASERGKRGAEAKAKKEDQAA